MTFQQLQYFLEVHRAGSVTKAAKKLFVSYPSVSVAITNMEKELGVTLFARDARGLVLTQKGERVLEYANSISQAYAMMNQVRQEGRRVVRINGGDYPTIGKAFAGLLEENQNRSDLELILTTCDTEDSFRKLVNGELAMGIMMFMQNPQSNGEKRLKREGLQWERLRQIPVSVCVGKGHPLYEARQVSLEQAREHVLVATTHLKSRGALYRMICTDPEKLLRVSTMNARSEIVRRGLGYTLAVMPPKEQREKEGIRYIPLEGTCYNMVAAVNPQMIVPPEAERFLELLKQQLQADYPEE